MRFTSSWLLQWKRLCESGVIEYVYTLRGPGFECREGLEVILFSRTYRPAVGPTHPPVQWVPGWSGCSAKLTSHLHLVPRLRMNGITPLLPHMPSRFGHRLNVGPSLSYMKSDAISICAECNTWDSFWFYRLTRNWLHFWSQKMRTAGLLPTYLAFIFAHWKWIMCVETRCH
jgi:hypothetical protein